MTPRFAPGAGLEAVDLGDWFEARRAGGAAGFAADPAGLIGRLVAQPRMFGRERSAPRGREVRTAAPVGRFPAVVRYEVTATEVVILSVTHARSRRQP